jgi:hypothetical protein
MNAGDNIKQEEQVLLLLASLSKFYKPLVHSMLARNSTLQLDGDVRRETISFLGLGFSLSVRVELKVANFGIWISCCYSRML